MIEPPKEITEKLLDEPHSCNGCSRKTNFVYCVMLLGKELLIPYCKYCRGVMTRTNKRLHKLFQKENQDG